MRKFVSIMLALALILSSFTLAFSADSLKDVEGTEYQEAVNGLAEKGVIEGYPDGTFRPESTITRAEACVIVVKSMMPTEKELDEALYSGFPDLKGYEWADKYIRYAVQKAVVSGYTDGSFRPGYNVTYNEMAAMLVRALGYKVEELSGVWPENFISKAEELGMMDGFAYEGNSPALRGHVALMTYSVIDDIIEAHKPVEEEEEDEYDYADKAGVLADFSGTAYGIILDFAKVVNEKGEVVDEIEFLFGKNTLYLNTNGKVDVDSIDLAGHYVAGDIFGLKMRNGIVTGIDTSATNFGDKEGFENLGTGVVQEIKNYYVKFKESDDTEKGISILDDASIYKAVEEGGEITGFKAASIRDVRKGYTVWLYSVTGETPGVAEIVLIKE
ncbi:MAG: S-layer homology domain-containing protein [Clostridiales bacterium]|nr:S-layer homology domain-containing protein [Clostridiales bacterium]